MFVKIMMIGMMTVRMRTVRITIIVASSALPTLPNATVEMCTKSKNTQVMTTIMMMKGDDDHHVDEEKGQKYHLAFLASWNTKL